MAADRHAHQPVTVRPSAGPGGDRAWLLAYAAHAGLAEGKPEMAALRAVIMLAIAEFRASHGAELPSP